MIKYDYYKNLFVTLLKIGCDFMKRLTVLQLIPGMIVAENVLSYDHQLILSRGSVLTDRAITRLDLYGIMTVCVEEFLATDLDISNTDITLNAEEDAPNIAITELTHFERVRNSEEFKYFKAEYEQGLDNLKDSLNNVVERNLKLDISALLQNCLDVIAGGKGQFGVIDMLYNMKDYDNSTYAHCMNVALICHIFAGWLKWSPADVETATICGLLHDIGKLTIPHAILTKPGKLSPEEYTQIKRHPISGYQLLLSQDVSDHVRYSALMHHERMDGTGYPMHLTGKQIDKFSRLVAIADVYDAMTSSRVYRGPVCPFRVIEIFEDEGFQKYDVEFLLPFLENVVNTYLQNQCRLNDGRCGSIIFVNKTKLSRPIVQCGKDYVNLADFPELTITDLL